MYAVPYGIELVGGSIDQHRVVSQYSRFEITGRSAFHAESCSGQIGRTDISHPTIEDQNLEMDARTQLPLQPTPQQRVFIEIVGKIPPGLFGMNQPYLDTVANKFSNTFSRGTDPAPSFT